uniref:Ig-like domain-containing protein n=1 Tax=Astyanax mexicanus TaxID=7994 RepID=A0A3B1JXK9_ASTMX
MECRFSGTKPLKARWLRDGKELTSGRKYKVQSTDKSSTLKILTAERSDEGEYVFEVSNDVGNQIIKPSFTRKLKEMESIKGSFAQLDCLVSGSLPISITWFKENKEIEADEKHKCIFYENAASLEITRLDSSDSGSYTCIATNKAGTDQCSGVLKVKEPPKFTRKPDRVSVVRPGEAVFFECQVVGTPEIDIYWFRDGNEISQSSKHKMSFSDSLARLEITGAETKDSGVYYCEARNEAGSESCSMEMKVKEPPVIVKPFSPVEVVNGFNALFECQVKGTAPFEITWQKDSKEIKASTKHLISQKNGSVMILDVQKCDALDVGEYNCIITNEVGKIINVTAGDPVSFECKVTGTPELKVKWSKGGKEVIPSRQHSLAFSNSTSNLKIQSVQLEDGGSYLFEVSNHISVCKCEVTLNVVG